jgi:hypothetical protein
MAELKTKLNDKNPFDYLDILEDENKREDCKKIIDIFKEVS